MMISIVILALGLGMYSPSAAFPNSSATSVLGTWTGDSTCTGNRPACRNEVVVYRFEAIPGKPDEVMQYADKIINGQRVPMGKLEFQYNKAKGELSCDFTINQTHGLWSFSFAEDTMVGTLLLLPDRELVRNVKVRRVKESDVPKAPSKDQYDS